MKFLSCIFILVLLSACAKKDDSYFYGALVVEGSNFETTRAPIYEGVVETSIVKKNGEVVYLPAITPLSGNVSIDLGNNQYQTIESHAYFAYVFDHNGVFYNFYKDNGGIFAKKSNDLLTWTALNNGQAVLSEVPGTDYQFMWNPGLVVDDNGVWHLLVECGRAASQSDVGLCYSTATMNGDTIDFNVNKSTGIVLLGGGNPWIGNVAGKGLVAVYGKANSPASVFGNEWYVAAAVLPNGQTTWVESNNFRIGATGIHVCDPHLVETPNGVSLLLSYDQHSVYEMKTSQTMSELYDSIALP